MFSGTVLNVRKHIFERKRRKLFCKFGSIVNKYRLVIGCNKCMIRHCVIWELIDIVHWTALWHEDHPLRLLEYLIMQYARWQQATVV